MSTSACAPVHDCLNDHVLRVSPQALQHDGAGESGGVHGGQGLVQVLRGQVGLCELDQNVLGCGGIQEADLEGRGARRGDQVGPG